MIQPVFGAVTGEEFLPRMNSRYSRKNYKLEFTTFPRDWIRIGACATIYFCCSDNYRLQIDRNMSCTRGRQYPTFVEFTYERRLVGEKLSNLVPSTFGDRDF